MADYIRSDQPSLTFSVDQATESLLITVINPTPTGGRPAVSQNYVYRRPTTSTGVWTLVGATGNNNVILDTFQRSNASFDYYVVTDSAAESAKYTMVTPQVSGMWVYAAGDTGTLQHFRYTDGGAENLDEQESLLQLVGRTYPIVESGVQETQTIAVNVRIPFSDTDWSTQVEWWRLRKREKRTLLYRDGRGRVFACRILGPVGITPTRSGATITCTLQRVDYTFYTITVDPTYFNAGAYNNGGNGAYGNGEQGNGV